MKHFVVLIVVLLLAVSCEGLAKKRIRKYRKCTDISDCPCGSVCVRRLGGILFNTPCTSLFPRLCACKRGCQVFDKVIPAGESQRVYCNTCNCPQNSASTKGIPACTRAAWCIKPRYPPLDVYKRNPNCPTKG